MISSRVHDYEEFNRTRSTVIRTLPQRRLPLIPRHTRGYLGFSERQSQYVDNVQGFISDAAPDASASWWCMSAVRDSGEGLRMARPE